MHSRRHSPTTRPNHYSAEKSGALLSVLLISQLMVILDITAVNIALPSLAADLNLTGSDISWTITSYSLIFGSLLLFGGRRSEERRVGKVWGRGRGGEAGCGGGEGRTRRWG